MTRRPDDGFTLIELVVAVIILGIIIVPLTGAIIISLGTIARTDQRTTDTSDQQLAQSWFASDVASADKVGTAGTCSVGNPVVTLVNAADTDDPTPAETVTYCADGARLVRQSSGAPITVARDLSGTPSVTCDGGTCPASGGTPRVVRMAFTDKAAAAYDSGQLDITLQAIRRTS